MDKTDLISIVDCGIPIPYFIITLMQESKRLFAYLPNIWRITVHLFQTSGHILPHGYRT